MYRFLTFISLFAYFNSWAQIDQKKLDSLKRSIEVSTKTQKSWQDSFANAQDSIYKTAINNGDSVNLSTQQKTTVKDKQIIIRIVIFVALFLIAVFLALRQKRSG